MTETSRTSRFHQIAVALAATGLALAVVACGAGADGDAVRGISKSAACEEARKLINASTSDAERSSEDVDANREAFRVELQEIVDRANREGAEALQAWVDALKEQDADREGASSPTFGPKEAEEQRQIGRSVKACGWIFEPSTQGYLAPSPLDTTLDASASVGEYVQEACLTRLRIQRVPLDEAHLRDAIPEFRAIEQTASRGLETYPDSDDLRALDDWARGSAWELENPGQVADYPIDLPQRVASICDEALQGRLAR